MHVLKVLNKKISLYFSNSKVHFNTFGAYILQFFYIYIFFIQVENSNVITNLKYY
jgi:hypothetical protein